MNLGSGDSDAFQYDANTGRMTQYKHNVGSYSVTGNLIWNPNGSLETLAITDTYSSANTQTCNYGYDDLARSIGQAIVEQAEELGVDLIVVGSSPRWRRQSRFFSPTVEYVLKKAPCEVLVVAFPQGVLEEEEEPVFEPTEVS